MKRSIISLVQTRAVFRQNSLRINEWWNHTLYLSISLNANGSFKVENKTWSPMSLYTLSLDLMTLVLGLIWFDCWRVAHWWFEWRGVWPRRDNSMISLLATEISILQLIQPTLHLLPHVHVPNFTRVWSSLHTNTRTHKLPDSTPATTCAATLWTAK